MMLAWVLSAVQQWQDLITNSLYKQLVNKVRKKSWMLLFTITLIELTIQETNHECQGNCFLGSRLDLIRVSLRKGYLSIALDSNCKIWIRGKFMYHFILERAGKGFFFFFLVRILRCGSAIWLTSRKSKKTSAVW